MSKPNVTRIGCYGVITEGQKILLCRLCDGLQHHGRWTLPGGGLDFGETLEETVVREVREETGLEVCVGPIIYHRSRLWHREHDTMHSFQFLFLASIRGGDLTNETNGSTDLAQWVEISLITEENSVDIVHDAVSYLKQLS